MVKFSSKLGIILLAVLLLALPLLAACDDDETEEPTATATEPTTPTDEPTVPVTEPTAPVTEPVVEELEIKIGLITDKTGPAAQALVSVDAALIDNIRYFEEMGLFPEGVTVEVIEYDSQYDFSQFIPAYEWLMERDIDILVSGVPGTGAVLKTRVDEDGMVFYNLTATSDMYTPPGYVFSVNIGNNAMMSTMLDWIAKNDPNFPQDRPAKIGGMGMEDPYVQYWLEGMEAYCDANPEWEFVEGIIVGWTTMTFAPEVEALKECDYIIPPSTGFALPNFMTEYRQAGHTATFLGNDAQNAFLGLMIDAAGWDVMDGMYMMLPYTWYNEDTEVVERVNYALNNYHTETEKGALLWSGGSYRGGFTQWLGVVTMIQEALEANGVSGFNTESFYQYIQTFSGEIDGNTWDYSPTDRQSWLSMGMFQLDAEVEDLVRVDPNMFPVIFEP